MGGILAPNARAPQQKNFHRDNIQKMHQREQEIQMKRETESHQG